MPIYTLHLEHLLWNFRRHFHMRVASVDIKDRDSFIALVLLNNFLL